MPTSGPSEVELLSCPDFEVRKDDIIRAAVSHIHITQITQITQITVGLSPDLTGAAGHDSPVRTLLLVGTSVLSLEAGPSCTVEQCRIDGQ